MAYRISAGGSTATLTPQQEQQAQYFASVSLRKGYNIGKYAEQLGGSSSSVYKRASYLVSSKKVGSYYSQQSMVEYSPSYAQGKMESTGQGVYNPETGVYIDTQGLGSSMREAPKGAVISYSDVGKIRPTYSYAQTPTTTATTTPTKLYSDSSFIPSPRQQGASLSSIDVPSSYSFSRAEPSAPKYNVDLFRKAGREFFYVEQGKNPLDAFGTLASPLQKYFPEKKGDTKVTLGSTFGSTQNMGLTSEGSSTILGSGSPVTMTKTQWLDYKTMTKTPEAFVPSNVRYFKTTENIAKDLQTDIQGKIDTGKLSLEQGQAEYSKQYESKIFKIDMKQFESSDIFREKKIKLNQPSFDVSKTGEFAGLFTPFGAVGYASGGIPLWGKASLGSDLTKTERAKLFGKGSLHIGLGLGMGAFRVKASERASDRLLVKDLLAKEGKIKGTGAILSPRSTLFNTSSFKNIGGEAGIKTGLFSPTFRTTIPATTKFEKGKLIKKPAKDIFSVTGGRGVTKYKIWSTEKGKFIEGLNSYTFSSPNILRSKTSPWSAWKTPQTSWNKVFSKMQDKKKLKLKKEDTFGFAGDVTILPKGSKSFSIEGFGGSSRSFTKGKEKFMEVKGGEQTGLVFKRKKIGGFIFEKEPAVRYKVLEKGEIKMLDFTGKKGFPKSSGKLKVIKQEKNPLLETSPKFKDIYKPTTPSTKLKPLQKQKQTQVSFPMPVGIAPQVEKQIFKQTPMMKPDLRVAKIGAGSLITKPLFAIKEKQTQSQVQSPMLKLKSKTKMAVGTKTKTSFASILGKKTAQKLKVATKQKTKLKQKAKTKFMGTPIPPVNLKGRITPRSPPMRFGFRFMKMPSFKSGFSKTTRRTSFGFKPPIRSPSLVAIGRGIKSSSKGFVESSGITIRPILVKKKKRIKRIKPIKKKKKKRFFEI